MKAAASTRSMTRLQLFWHSLSHIRRFSPLRMTKQGDARTQHVVTSRWGLLNPEPIHLNPEPSIRSYYMTTEEI